MTLDEAVTLLREARECVVGRCNTGLRDRIDAALAAHDAEPAELDWAREHLPHANETRLVARTEDFVFHIRGDGGCMLYEGNDNPYGYHHTVDQAKAHAAEIVKQARSAR